MLRSVHFFAAAKNISLVDQKDQMYVIGTRQFCSQFLRNLIGRTVEKSLLDSEKGLE